ncbi:DUF2905 domain-containing protein [Thermus albus]|uniref:DUF2905 domain-containing protein n=1 Tax=Thermus albus TaxID=2908146 RepID=UPI001FAB1139
MEAGKTLLFLGFLLVLLGLLFLYAPKLFSWFGHLPGDIRIEREGLKVYIPIASTLVLSLLFTLLWNLLAFLRR